MPVIFCWSIIGFCSSESSAAVSPDSIGGAADIFFCSSKGCQGLQKWCHLHLLQKNGAVADQSGDPDISVAPTSQQEQKKNFFLPLQVKSPGLVAASLACGRHHLLLQPD